MSFTVDIQRFADKAEAQALKVFKSVSFGLSTSIIKDTPVDTGRARGNWQPSINRSIDDSIETLDKGGDSAVAKALSATKTLRLGDKYYLTNNLPYILRLEYGWSKQAPNGMVRKNVILFQDWVTRSAK